MIKLATVFSGIGSVEQALKKMKIPHELIFACDNGERELKIEKEEILLNTKEMNSTEKEEYVNLLYKNLKKPNYMEISYLSNYNLKKENFHQDIRFIDGKKYFGRVDLIVGGSPCQSFSIIGKRGGFNDTRGTLFYEYARLVKETSPKVFIYENVRGMLNHDKGKTWETIKNVFNELNYNIYIDTNPILNAKDYGIPQNRPRIFVVGIRKDIELKKEFSFPNKLELTKKVSDYYEKDIDEKYYLGQKGFEFVTNPKYKNRAQINQDIMMCQKANQQFNWNGDFVFEEFDKIKHTKKVMERAYKSIYQNKEGVIRKLTPRECLRLMGFEDDFKIVVPDTQLYRQSGNSIVVNIFEELLKELEETGVWI